MYLPKATACLLLFSLVGSFGVSMPASAETAEEKGLAIAEEMDRRDLGFGDSVSELEMILTNRQGKTATRYLKIKALEVQDRELGDKSLVIFDRPPDVKGTVLLTHSKILEPDDQWIYFPALGQKGRIKRIDSRSKSGPFMGSEFSYEDMSSREVGKYNYKWLRDEACGQMTCHVVESYPLYEGSGYTKIISWIDTGEYRVHKIEFFNRGGAHFKTLILSNYQKYLDKFWRAHDLYMVNNLTGKNTRLLMSRFEFRQGLEDRDFTRSRMATAK
ncbi:outer membrane lipoprotein-sorting protein [Emcibacter sp.]|uniref:outer membrane lipoprotein-sorting protein n=1 Tax=Emcibacter sp. TaxID=1979954 RepID=UPI002AA78ECB|nr:outer membrane lipoprotein-sorting protein [Emcibacter sp.]